MKTKRFLLRLVSSAAVASLILLPTPILASENGEDNRVTIGTALDYPPYSFLDANGQPTGYSVELTRAIAKVMGLDVEIRIGPWGEIREALESGRIDAICEMFYSRQRDELVDFSPTYTIVHHAIFARSDSPTITSEQQLRGKEIIVARGDIMNDYVMEKGLCANPVRVDTQADVFRLLASGKHDYALVAKLPGRYWVRELGLSNVEVAGPLLRPSEYSYAVQEGNVALLSRLKEGLAIVKHTGRYKETCDKWLGVLEPRGVPTATILRYAAFILIPLFLLLAGSALWSRTLKRLVTQRTAELEKEITDRKRAEEDLVKQSLTNQLLLDSLPYPAMLIRKDRVVVATNRVAREVGAVQGGLCWRDYGQSKYIPEADKQYINNHKRVPPGGTHCTFCLANEALDAQTPTNAPFIEAFGRIWDAHWIPLDHETYLHFAIDMSERKKAEEALRESENRIRNVLESLPIVLVCTEAVSNRKLMIGGAIESVTGYKTDHFFADPEFGKGIVHPEDAELVGRAFADGLESRRPFELEYRILHGQTGQSVWLYHRVAPIVGPDGKLERHDSILLDITGRKQAEKERDQLKQQLLQSQKLEAIGTLATGIAHDFSNFVTVVSGCIDQVKTSFPAGQPALQPLKIAEQALADTTRITHSLLIFTGKTMASKSVEDLCEIVRDSLRLLRRLLPASIEFDMEIPSDRPIWVQADVTQVHQVLMNLATNARDAMPDGGRITISVRQEDETPASSPPVEQDDGTTSVLLIVEDTGSGMTEETLSRLFDPFFTTKTREKGTGLGMSVAHGIVLDHQGQIAAESELGRGTRILIRLPCCDPPEQITRLAVSESGATDGHGKTVLLVEDNRYIRTIMAEMLTTSGFAITQASDGHEAMTTFKAMKDTLDLLILDLDLPRKNGLACLKEIRKTQSDIPVIIITGSAEYAVEETAHERQLLLRKPFQMAELASLAFRLLSEPRCTEEKE